MNFEVIGGISQAETIAVGKGIREIARLRKIYGGGRWRKRKGIARIRLADGSSTWLRYIGARQAASAARNSRSRNCFQPNDHE